jgi:hypothetical protein
MTRLALLLCGALLLTAPAVAVADPPTMAPGQEFSDQAGPGSGMANGTWSDLPGGVAARPYVKSLTVINGGQSVPVFSGGVSAAGEVASGDVTAVISATNLCGPGQAPEPGRCYSTPNRVGIAFGYKTDQGVGLDFSSPTVPLRQTVDADTVFDVVIGLNTLGKTLRWTWANGQVVSWKTTNVGNDDAEIRLRIKPTETPNVDWSKYGPVGCTATPIRDCDIPRADGRYLGAQMVLSLDDTLSPALTGAMFATQGGLYGFLSPGGSSTAPTLDLQMASAHLAFDGSPQRGALQAFLPASALISLYGVLPGDATTFFTTTRTGDAGTQDAPRFTARTDTDTDSAGLVISVDAITFSAPTYRVARKTAAVRVSSAVHGRRVSIKTAALAVCRHRACSVTVHRTATGLSGKTSKIATARSTAGGAVAVTVATVKLPRKSGYIVAIRRAGKIVASARGVV